MKSKNIINLTNLYNKHKTWKIEIDKDSGKKPKLTIFPKTGHKTWRDIFQKIKQETNRQMKTQDHKGIIEKKIKPPWSFTKHKLNGYHSKVEKKTKKNPGKDVLGNVSYYAVDWSIN